MTPDSSTFTPDGSGASSTPPAHDPPPTDRAARVAAVADWILAGIRPSQIPAQAARQRWDVAAGELAELVAEAAALIRADADIDPAAEDAVALNRLRSLYTRAVSVYDVKSALAVQKEIARTVARLSDPMIATDDDDDDTESAPDGIPRTETDPDRP